MSSIVESTLRLLQEARSRYDACLVAFSGGKDACATLDLCTRVFSRVEAFYCYTTPGLEWTKQRLDAARDRWSVPIHEIPHPEFLIGRATGVFCVPDKSMSGAPDTVSWDGVNAMMRQKTGIELIASGVKASDGVWRKRWMSTTDKSNTLWPLSGWNKFDVLGYLKARGIPRPDGDGGDKQSSGEDLSHRFLCWLHDNHPEDFKRVEEYWPFARAEIKRREWFGVD